MYIKSFNKTSSKKNIEKSSQPKQPNKLLARYSQETLMHWQAPEFETIFRREKKWYMYISLILVAIVAYAIYTNSPLMAIVFVLIGIVGYIYIQQDARILDFMITEDGIVAGREIYQFENISSFWIFYEPNEMKVISLRNRSCLLPFVHIPIHDQDPVKIRKILLKFIPEEKQNPSAMDFLERLIGI
jgi:hypothetical protein